MLLGFDSNKKEKNEIMESVFITFKEEREFEKEIQKNYYNKNRLKYIGHGITY